MKKVLLVVVLMLAGAAGFVFLRMRAAMGNYEGVASIKTLPAYQEPGLLDRAWALTDAAAYPRPLVWQTNPSACGPTAVANVLRSVGRRDATSDAVAANASGCLGGICFGGLTLDQLADAARAEWWSVTVLRGLTPAEFKEELLHANDPTRRYVVNFHRGPLFGAGGGHHSPIGGYLADQDLVFVLDVNEKFGPWLVSSERLLEAMRTVDPSTKLERGLLRLELK